MKEKYIAVDRLVSLPELKSVFGVPYSRQNITKLQKEGKFPKNCGVPGKGRKLLWRASDIASWVQRLVDARDAQ